MLEHFTEEMKGKNCLHSLISPILEDVPVNSKHVTLFYTVSQKSSHFLIVCNVVKS